MNFCFFADNCTTVAQLAQLGTVTNGANLSQMRQLLLKIMFIFEESVIGREKPIFFKNKSIDLEMGSGRYFLFADMFFFNYV